MPYRFWLKLAAIATAVALMVAALEARRADRRDRAQIAAELAATKQLLIQADAHQHDRDTQLAKTLAVLAEQKRAIVTPAQIVRELQSTMRLPAPITLQALQAPTALKRPGASPLSPPQLAFAASDPEVAPTNAGASSKNGASLPQQAGSAPANSTSAKSAQAPVVIPAADLKPLYDFTLDCQACQAKLSASQSDLADEKSKTVALTKERDAAVRLAKGGSVWRRAARAAKWFLLGAAAGAIASKASH